MEIYWNEELGQIQTNLFTYYYYEEDEEFHLDIKTTEGNQDESYLGNICSASDDEWREKIENFIKEFESKEENIKFAKRVNTEVRRAKISINKKGGTSGIDSVGYRIILPNAWMRKIGIAEENREVNLSFDGERIIIEKSH